MLYSTQAVSASKEEFAPHRLRERASSTLLSQLHQLKHTNMLTNQANVDWSIFSNASDDFCLDKFSDHFNTWSDKL